MGILELAKQGFDKVYDELNLQSYEVMLEAMVQQLKIDLADIKYDYDRDPELQGCYEAVDTVYKALQTAKKVANRNL